MKTRQHVALHQREPIRFQEYGVGLFPSISTKSAIKKAIKREEITIDGRLASTASFIKGGEIIEFTPKNTPSREVKVAIDIVYEDEYFAVIDKPAGIEVGGNKHRTITNALSQFLRNSRQTDALPLPLPVHRLDFATSGLLISAKTKGAQVFFERSFRKKTIQKTYHAVTVGEMQPPGLIDVNVDDKVAITEFEVLKTIPSERFTCLNLVVLHPKTGRRHQLRKHLKSIGNAILGDAIYSEDALLLKGKGLYLHATKLSFIHPISEEIMSIELPLPAKFKKLFPNLE